MGCAAGLPVASATLTTDKGPLAVGESGVVRKGAVRSAGSQDVSHQISDRSTKASTRSTSSGAALCHPVLLATIDGSDEDALSASNFNEETGAPDMGNAPLRVNLRKTEQWFENTCSGNPQDFPRLAREFTRRRRRPQASTADDSDLMPEGERSPGGGAARRFSTPVLAEPRFDEPSSLQTEAEMWRLWSAKDLPLSVPPRADKENHDSTIEDCLAGEFASLSSTCLPQADNEGILEDEELSDEQSPPSPLIHVPPVEGVGQCPCSLAESMKEALRKALVDGVVAGAGDVAMEPSTTADREEVLILLDWDDTILPTTWLAGRPWFRTWVHEQASRPESMEELIQVDDRKALEEMDLAACEFLEEMTRWGQVVCITLAQRPWVQQSMKAFLPRLAQRWEEVGVPVYYAVEEYARKNLWGSWCKKSSGPSLLESTVLEMNFRATQKFKVMKRLLRRFYKSKNHCNAISIGDGLAERNGLKEIAWCQDLTEGSDDKGLQVKTIQMLEDPTCAQLNSELKVLRTWLPCVIGCTEDVDAVLG